MLFKCFLTCCIGIAAVAASNNLDHVVMNGSVSLTTSLFKFTFLGCSCLKRVLLLALFSENKSITNCTFRECGLWAEQFKCEKSSWNVTWNNYGKNICCHPRNCQRVGNGSQRIVSYKASNALITPQSNLFRATSRQYNQDWSRRGEMVQKISRRNWNSSCTIWSSTTDFRRLAVEWRSRKNLHWTNE